MADFNVSNFDELKTAIEQSKNNSQADNININSDVTLTELLPSIEEDQSLTINGKGNTIDGDGQYRHFFVRSGTVNFDNLTFDNGLAKGGDGSGGGAGMGGSLFVYDGDVTVTNSTFSNNRLVRKINS